MRSAEVDASAFADEVCGGGSEAAREGALESPERAHGAAAALAVPVCIDCNGRRHTCALGVASGLGTDGDLPVRAGPACIVAGSAG